MVDTSLLFMKSSPSAASPHMPSSHPKSPGSLKNRLHLRGVFSKKVKSPPLTEDVNMNVNVNVNMNVNSKLKLSQHDAMGQESLSNRSSRIHDDDYGASRSRNRNPAGAEESSSVPLLESPRRPCRKLFTIDNGNDNDNDNDNGDDDNKALIKKTKKKDGSASTLSTTAEEQDDSNNNAGGDHADIREYNYREQVQVQVTPHSTKSKKMRRQSLGVVESSTPRDAALNNGAGGGAAAAVVVKKHKKKMRRASVGAMLEASSTESRFEQAISSSVADTAKTTMSTPPTIKKKKPHKTEEELVPVVESSTPNNGAKKRTKKIRRASVGVVVVDAAADATSEDVNLEDTTKTSKKKKQIRSNSVGPLEQHSAKKEKKKNIRSTSVGAVDTKSRRKSSSNSNSSSMEQPPKLSRQPTHGTMKLNDADDDEPPMTPRTKARMTVGNDGKIRRMLSKTDVAAAYSTSEDDGGGKSPRSTHSEGFAKTSPISRSSDAAVSSVQSDGRRGVVTKEKKKKSKTEFEPLNDDDSQRSPTAAHRMRCSAIKPPPLDTESPDKYPGNVPVRKERSRSSETSSKPDKNKSVLSDITYSDISADTFLMSQASDRSINSEISFGNPQVLHLRKTVSQLKAQVDTFKEQHQAANVQASKARTELISVKVEYQKAQTERRELRVELRESEAIVEDKDRKIAALEKAVESQLDKVDELEEQLTKASDEIYQLQDKILQFEVQIQHGDEGSRSNHRAEEKNIQLDEQRHARLEKRQQELDEQLQQIQRERSQLEKLRLDNDSQRSGEHLQQAVESLKQIQAETAKKLSEKDETVQELQRKLEVAWQLNMEGIVNSSVSITGADQQEKDKQGSDKKLLQEEKHQLSATLEKKDETIAYMQLELNRLKQGLEASAGSGGDFASLKREVDARKAEAQVATSKYEGAQRRNMHLEDDIDHWKSLNCNLEDEVQAFKAEACEWKVKYEQMRQQQQAGMVSDSRSPVHHSPFHSPGSSHSAGELSRRVRASRRRASMSGGIVGAGAGGDKSGVGYDMAEMPSSSSMSGNGSVNNQRNFSNNNSMRDSVREMCSPMSSSRHHHVDASVREGSVREGSLRGIRGLISNLVSPPPLTNNSSHLQNSKHIPRAPFQ